MRISDWSSDVCSSDLSAIVGAAAGAALAGKRPVAELMFADFIGVSLDQLWNQMGKFRYLFGGKTKCPAVVRMIYGAGMNAAAQHSQVVYARSEERRGGKGRVSTGRYWGCTDR